MNGTRLKNRYAVELAAMPGVDYMQPRSRSCYVGNSDEKSSFLRNSVCGDDGQYEIENRIFEE